MSTEQPVVSERLQGLALLAAGSAVAGLGGFGASQGHGVAGIILGCIALVVLMLGFALMTVQPEEQRETDDHGRTVVRRQHWRGRTVPLDGYRFVECRFEGCTLLTKRRDYALEDCAVGPATVFADEEFSR